MNLSVSSNRKHPAARGVAEASRLRITSDGRDADGTPHPTARTLTAHRIRRQGRRRHTASDGETPSLLLTRAGIIATTTTAAITSATTSIVFFARQMDYDSRYDRHKYGDYDNVAPVFA